MAGDSMIFIDNSESENENNDCILCDRQLSLKDFPKIINKALERKYCSNLNTYFILKPINKIINGEK